MCFFFFSFVFFSPCCSIPQSSRRDGLNDVVRQCCLIYCRSELELIFRKRVGGNSPPVNAPVALRRVPTRLNKFRCKRSARALHHGISDMLSARCDKLCHIPNVLT